MLNWGYILPKDFKYWKHFSVYPLDLNRLKGIYLWSYEAAVVWVFLLLKSAELCSKDDGDCVLDTAGSAHCSWLLMAASRRSHVPAADSCSSQQTPTTTDVLAILYSAAIWKVVQTQLTGVLLFKLPMAYFNIWSIFFDNTLLLTLFY